MQEKRQNGQCYFCPEPFSKEHKCAARGGVFLMDLGDDEEDPLRDITDLEISLNALTGLNSADSVAAGDSRWCTIACTGGYRLHPHVHSLRACAAPGSHHHPACWPQHHGG